MPEISHVGEATIAQVVEATGVRGALAGALKKASG
jgi:hypothetical protein